MGFMVFLLGSRLFCLILLISLLCSDAFLNLCRFNVFSFVQSSFFVFYAFFFLFFGIISFFLSLRSWLSLFFLCHLFVVLNFYHLSYSEDFFLYFSISIFLFFFCSSLCSLVFGSLFWIWLYGSGLF